MDSTEILVVVGAVILIVAVLWYFFGPAIKDGRPRR